MTKEEEKDIDKELMSLYSGILDDGVDINQNFDYYPEGFMDDFVDEEEETEETEEETSDEE